MTEKEDETLGNVIQMCRQLDRKPHLRDAMAILDERNLRAGGNTMYQKPSAYAGDTASSTNLIPGPMELGAMSGRSSDTCARCKGEGHWTSVCPTPRHWKKGEKVAGFKPRYEGQRGLEKAVVKYTGEKGGSKRREKAPDGKKAQSYSTELDPGKENGDDSDSGSEEGSEDPDSAEEPENESGKA
jgi:hypothetical protein